MISSVLTFLAVAALTLAGPVALGVAAAAAFRGGVARAAPTARLAETAAAIAFAAGVFALVFVAAVGSAEFTLPGGPLSIGLRLDVVSVVMAVLVAGVGFVVVRYARTYLSGEPNQGRFTAWLMLTLASVLVFVQAGTLLTLFVPFVAMSLFLDRLLVFYPERGAARRAARKKFLAARLGDLMLIGAAIALWEAFGTANIGEILAAARIAEPSQETLVAAALLAGAALLKSAQFPLHGWLTEVMETPTPVSALLHAGVVNAGGVLLIRFADVLLLAPGVLAVLVLVGGFTALLGSLVMLTQPAVKTSLAWSTVAQMGFMIFQCGLALFPLALLHIVAHSLYKAHAFLASGGAVETVAAIARPGPVAIPDARSVGFAFLIAIGIYALVAMGFTELFGAAEKSVQAIALGAILVFGVGYLLAQGLADAAPWPLTVRTSLYSLGAAVGYFALQRAAEWVTAGTLPPTPAPEPLEWALIVLALASFAVVALAQAMFPLWAYHPAAAGLRVHLSNGLYANAALDRILGGWRLNKTTGASS